MKSGFSSLPCAVLTATALFTLPLAVQADPLIVIVVTNGAAAPDGIGTLSSFGNPVLNDAGQVAFIANLAGTGVGPTNETGVYRGDEIPSHLTQIVRQGQAAPNGGGLVFSNDFLTSDVPVMNNRGQVAFFGTVSGPSNNLGIFLGSGTPASLANIVQVGQTAPDGNGRFTGSLSINQFPSINDAGQVAFYSQIAGATNGNQIDGIFLGNGATRTQIARSYYPGPSGNFIGYYFSDPVLNNLGQVAFQGVTTGNTNEYYRSDGSTLTQIAWGLENTATSEPAPDVNGGINGVLNDFTRFQPSLNDAGQVAFITAFFATTNTSNAGIVRGDGTPLVAIARTYELAPDGTNTLYQFWVNAVSYGAALNNAGQVAFAATLDGGTTWGIFRGAGTVASLTEIMLQGQTAPDTNVTFNPPGFATPALNDAGQVVFTDGIDNCNACHGIYFYDDKLGLLKVIRTGDPLLGSTVALVRFFDTAPALGRPGSGLNNRGQVAFYFSLLNGTTGIAIWNVPVFRITDIQTAASNVRLTWNTLGGRTNVVQATSGQPDGSFSDSFTDLSGSLVVPGSGQVSTNYVDTGGATNQPSRYYRVRLVP